MARRKEQGGYAPNVEVPHARASDVAAPAVTGAALARILEQDPAVAALEASADWPADASAVETYAVYEEYLRMLDDVPVLSDIVDEPPRVRIRDFRRGERPDARKHPREDPYTLRERHLWEIDRQYAEYVESLTKPQAEAPPARAKKTPKKKARPKRAKRKKR